MKLLLFLCALLAISVAAPSDHSTLEAVRTSSDDNESSPFLKVIKTPDIAKRDTIYNTPPVYFIGETKGNILRCLQEDRTVCEVFYKGSWGINSMVIHMEHLYAADAKTVVKCDSHSKNTCRTIFACDDGVYTLEIGSGNLYMGLSNGTILYCDPHEPINCRIFHTLKDRILKSIKQIGKHLYASLDNGEVKRCSLFAENKCTTVYNTSASYLYGLNNIRDNLIAVSYEDGKLLNCSHKLDATLECAAAALNFTSARNAAWFNSELYVLEMTKGAHTCKWGNDPLCSDYALQAGWSIEFLYGTYQLQSRYRNEQRDCTWQSDSKCPPFISYYGAELRAAFEVHVKDGKLYNSLGALVDTKNADLGCTGPAAIFVMTPGGTVLLSNAHKEELVHASSLFAGNPVSGAGEMVVVQGVIKSLTACSRHYAPDMNLNSQVVESLRSQGYTQPIESKPCCDNDCCVPISVVSNNY